MYVKECLCGAEGEIHTEVTNMVNRSCMRIYVHFPQIPNLIQNKTEKKSVFFLVTLNYIHFRWIQFTRKCKNRLSRANRNLYNQVSK